jgi:alkylated DNA repair dioxygenase AlkB
MISSTTTMSFFTRCRINRRVTMTETPKAVELPEGFLYHEDFLDQSEETRILDVIPSLEFESFQYKGFTAKRRVIAWGWSYDFNKNELSKGKEIPEFLLPVRERAAGLAGVAREELEEALLTEYPPGAPINWHRDLPMFEIVVGISLLSSCTMKLKSFKKDAKAVSLVLMPRSIYVMRGAARWQYQHSILPVKQLRYSITFRTLRK